MKLNKINTVNFGGTDIDRVKFNGSEMWNAWTYANGAPPLILPESIGKPLKKLYVEGNTVNANKELPETYRQLEYIESTGTQFFRSASITLPFKAKLEYEAQHISSSGNQRVFSYGSIANKNNFTMFEYNEGYWCSVLGAENQLPDATATEKHKIVMERTDETHCSLYINDALAKIYTGEFTQTVSIFTICGGNNQNYVGKLYYLKLWSDDVLIYDFIPCYRKSDNVVGLYDLVSKVFYTNSGTGEFIKGNEVTEVGYMGDLNEETGKYDVPITVRGKNLISTGSGINMTIHGVTIKRNDDGSLTVNGATTTSDYDEINLCQIYGRLNRKKRYTFSAKGAVVKQLQYEVQLRKNGAFVENVCTQTIPTFNFSTYTKEFDAAIAKLLILSGATFNNLTVYPQLEEGGAATPYEPYQEKTDLTVFLDTPIGAGESAYINAEIPTVKGTTIIEVNTSVPPAALKTYYRKGR